MTAADFPPTHDLSQKLVIGISSRVLFDLRKEHDLFVSRGLDAFSRHQVENEESVLAHGPGFPLTQAFLRLNEMIPGHRPVEIIIMSRNSADTGLRIFKSIDHYGLEITRAAFTSGVPLARYLHAFAIDLFLSADEGDVRSALDAGFAAGQVVGGGNCSLGQHPDQIRIAFDGDAVLFSGESEAIFRRDGIDAFHAHERKHASTPLEDGPFAKFLRTLAFVQSRFSGETPPIRTALVTARDNPAHERVIQTLRHWDVAIDEVFFLGGAPKDRVLSAFGAQIFFDDQRRNCEVAARVVPTARVPSD
ncbi:MAG: 5'-nucleotidase [Planctomycetota bacterium]|jgi:5'-nucleotidase